MIVSLLLAIGVAAAAPAGDPLEQAVEAELGRARAMKAEGYPEPYFISLGVTDIDNWERRCHMGSPGFAAEFKQRLATPDLRVGSHELDNHPLASPSSFVGRHLTTESDPASVRHSLWRLFDSAYKGATADFLRKQAMRVSRGKTEYDFDDLTREPARMRPGERPVDRWDRKRLSELCVEAGKVLRSEPALLHADSSARVRRQWTRLWDTEGSRVDFGREFAELEIEAVDISTDGLKLYASRRFAATTAGGLPSVERVRAESREMLEDLRALKIAKTTSPFSAPALVDPSVSAAVVLAIATRLSGEEQRNPAGAQTFRGKLGKQVLPPAFSLVDDPTVREHGGLPLAGHYEFDDQGIPARRVALVEDGLLKDFLLSRYPVVGFTKSNGHGRGFPGYWPEGFPGNLFLSSKEPQSQAALLERLRAECKRRDKPYGIWVRKLRHFAQQQGTGGHASIRFMPSLVYLVEAETGALTLVRDLDLVGTPLAMMDNLLAAGEDRSAANIVYGLPVSVIVPSLLLSDAELQRAETKPEKHPVLAAPGAPEPRARNPRIPIVPKVPHVAVMRYAIRGRSEPVTPFVMVGLKEMRQHGEGSDLIVEAKLASPTLGELGAALARMRQSLEALAPGLKIDESTVVSPMTASSYQQRYGAGWP